MTLARDTPEARAAARLPLAIWLLPSAADAPGWQQRIDRLAAQEGGPRFEAHVTVHVGSIPADGPDPTGILQAAAARHGPFDLEAGAAQATADFYRCVIAPMPGPASGLMALAALRADLLRAWIGHEHSDQADSEFALRRALSEYRLEPHLSLFYGLLDPPRRDQLAEREAVLGLRSRFDRLAFVRPRPGSTSLVQIDDWQVYGHCPLAGIG